MWVTFFGVYLYNSEKLKEAAAASAIKSAQENQALLSVDYTTQCEHKASDMLCPVMRWPRVVLFQPWILKAYELSICNVRHINLRHGKVLLQQSTW